MMIRRNLKTLLWILWFLLTVSLTAWWTILAHRQVSGIAELQRRLPSEYSEQAAEKIQRQERMIRMEGAFFLALITTAGVALVLLSLREEKRSRAMREFFAAMTHEIKTPLASLRLQAESLQDSLKNKRDKVLAERLIRNTERLELQMENAIFLSSLDRKNHLYIENINIYNFFQSLSFGYREVQIQTEKDLFVSADRRALEIIFRNSIENSIQHGKASSVILGADSQKGKTVLFIEDNGLGFQGDWKRLGQLFYRHRSGSGTGIGIYIMKILAKKIKSDIYFIRKEKGFRTEIVFQ